MKTTTHVLVALGLVAALVACPKPVDPPVISPPPPVGPTVPPVTPPTPPVAPPVTPPVAPPVQKPSVVAFTVDRQMLPPFGGTVNVTWDVQGAVEVNIDGLGKVDATGTQALKLTSSQTMTLKASNAGGTAEASVSVKLHDPTPINADWEQYGFDGKLGETKTLPVIKAFSAHVGADDRQEATFVYEPPEGWTILSYQLIENSRYGDSGYSASLTAKNSSFVSEERLNQVIKNTGDYAASVGDDSATNKLDELQGILRERFRRFESKNNHLEVPCFVQSHRVRGPFGVVLDTKTAFLDLDVQITLARIMTDAEAAILEYKLKRLIDQGLDPKEILN
jgi:hypothetical protein